MLKRLVKSHTAEEMENVAFHCFVAAKRRNKATVRNLRETYKTLCPVATIDTCEEQLAILNKQTGEVILETMKLRLTMCRDPL